MSTRWALVSSNEDGGEHQSYLRAFPDDGTNRTLLGPWGLTRWSRDGRAVTVEFAEQVRVIDRVRFGEAWVHTGTGLDVHPDGLRIVAPAIPVARAQDSFVVVVNALAR